MPCFPAAKSQLLQVVPIQRKLRHTAQLAY